MKRTRSASVTSDRPPPSVLARDITPLNVPKGPPGPPSTASTVRATNPRKRGGGRKSQAQDVASVDGEEGKSRIIAGACDVNSRVRQFRALHRHARATTAQKVRLPSCLRALHIIHLYPNTHALHIPPRSQQRSRTQQQTNPGPRRRQRCCSRIPRIPPIPCIRCVSTTALHLLEPTRLPCAPRLHAAHGRTSTTRSPWLRA